jgi:hypothetical protein
MTTRRTAVNSTLFRCGRILLALSLVAIAWAVAGEQVKQPPADSAARQRFLKMFARAYFPGRTGQLLIVPREDDFITRVAMTLADVWQLATGRRAIVLAHCSIDRAATPLAGHGACQLNGAPVVLASYDQQTGNWTTNPDCFRLPEYLKNRNARELWQAGREWMGHRIDSPTDVRYSALFPAFEADAMTAMIEREPVGADDAADLILLNYKGADFVGHKYGPDSSELRVTLAEMDHHLTRMLSALEAKVGNNYLLAVTADHGMPSEPRSPDRRHSAQSIVDLLHEKFDPEAKQLITSYEPENSQIFVDEDRLSALGLTLRDLAHFLESQPFLFAVFTQDDVRLAADAAK